MIGIPGIARADLGDILLTFHPYASVQEEYTNNLNLTPQNKQDALVTTVNAGLSYSTSPAPNVTTGLSSAMSQLLSGLGLAAPWSLLIRRIPSG